MEIRKAKNSDKQQLENLFLNTKINTFVWYPKNSFKLSDYTSSVEGEDVYVAVIDTIIVGFISVYLPEFFIHNLFVHHNHLRKGIGKKLLEKVTNIITQPLRLKVEIKNTNACRFYEKFGFTLISTHKNAEIPYHLYLYSRS